MKRRERNSPKISSISTLPLLSQVTFLIIHIRRLRIKRTIYSRDSSECHSPKAFIGISPKLHQLVFLTRCIQPLQSRFRTPSVSNQNSPHPHKYNLTPLLPIIRWPFHQSRHLIQGYDGIPVISCMPRQRNLESHPESFCKEDSPLLSSLKHETGFFWECVSLILSFIIVFTNMRSCGKIIKEQVEELHHGGVNRILKDIDTTVHKSPLGILPFSGYRQTRHNKHGSSLSNFRAMLSHARHFLTPCILSFPPDTCMQEDQTVETSVSDTKNSEAVPPAAQGVLLNQTSSSGCLSPPPCTGGSNARPSSRPDCGVNLTETHEWVHLCVEDCSGIVRLQSIDIRSLSTDGPVFSAIHNAYFGMSFISSLKGLLSLRALISVRFVHVSA